MATTYYVNIDNNAISGIGTSGSPYNYDQIADIVAISGDVFEFKGSRVSNSSVYLYIAGDNHDIKSWDLYGNWSISANDYVILGGINTDKIENGIIINTSANIDINCSQINNCNIITNGAVEFGSSWPIINGCSVFCKNYEFIDCYGQQQIVFKNCYVYVSNPELTIDDNEDYGSFSAYSTVFNISAASAMFISATYSTLSADANCIFSVSYSGVNAPTSINYANYLYPSIISANEPPSLLDPLSGGLYSSIRGDTQVGAFIFSIGPDYYVNAGGTNAFPWNLPDKGALRPTLISPYLESGDIIYVVNNGEVEETSGFDNNNVYGVSAVSGVTIRGYNGEKPTIKVTAGSHGLSTSYWKYYDLKIYKDYALGEPEQYWGAVITDGNVIISGCEIWGVNLSGCNNQAVGIYGGQNIKIINNIIRDFIQPGFFGAAINGDAAGCVASGTSALVYNNTIYNNEYGILDIVSENILVYNNIIHTASTGVYINWLEYCDGPAGLFRPNFSADYNDIYNYTNYYIEEKFGFPTSAIPKGLHDLSADPLFVDADNNDFRLKTNSPCIDAGLSGLTILDFRGVSRPQVIVGYTSITDGTDIGAYEMLSTEIGAYGEIGAFYFGTIYESVSASISTITVSAYVPIVSGIHTTSADIIAPISTIWISTINPEVFTTSDIVVDFVGVPRVGFSPLMVDFTVTVTFGGSYFNKFKVKEYIWYFDYENYPAVTETTTSPNITHVYSGYRGQKFDVRCCVTLESA